jgi:hypothetical protein
MQFYDSAEQVPNQSMNSMTAEDLSSQELLGGCRSHLESVQNLRHLVSLDVYNPKQVIVHLRMMDWHLRNLAELLLEPRMHNGN